jgi:hypothetical protein
VSGLPVLFAISALRVLIRPSFNGRCNYESKNLSVGARVTALSPHLAFSMNCSTSEHAVRVRIAKGIAPDSVVVSHLWIEHAEPLLWRAPRG